MAYQLTNRRKSWFQSPVMAVILVLLVGGGVLSVARALGKEREAAGMRNQYRRELGDMSRREEELQAQIASLSTERGVEAEIRERYRVVKPNEELVIIVDNGKPADPEPPKTWWEKVRMFVGI